MNLKYEIDFINLDDDTLESLIFNKANFEAYIKQLLLINHYRVEIFVNKGGKWALDYKGQKFLKILLYKILTFF